MNKKEWQTYHNLTDDEMERIESIVKIFNADPKKIKVYNMTFKQWDKMQTENSKKRRGVII